MPTNETTHDPAWVVEIIDAPDLSATRLIALCREFAPDMWITKARDTTSGLYDLRATWTIPTSGTRGVVITHDAHMDEALRGLLLRVLGDFHRER